MTTRPRAWCGLGLLLAACSHSDPFAAAPTRLDEPLQAAPPVQLTYAAGANTQPGVGTDGGALTYSFVRGTPDRDRCLGVLPLGGGTRLRSLCWTAPGQDTLADGLEVGALAADGRLAFTHHASRSNGIVAAVAGLYLAGGLRAEDGERLLPLLTFQPAAQAAWDYLLDLTWSGPNELSALATDVAMINRCYPATCWDTTHVALHVARLDLGTRPIGVTATPVAPTVAGLAIDGSTGRRFLRYPDRVTELLASGTEEVRYVPPTFPGQQGLRLTGLAAGGGRLYVTEAYTDVPPPNPNPGTPSHVSRLVRVIDGTASEVLRRADAQGSLGRVSVDPTGRRVVFEGRQGSARHLFLQEIP